MSDKYRTLSVVPLSGYEPEIGRVLWMLEEGRERLKQGLAKIDAAKEQAILDWRPRPGTNSIGTLLYHIAAIEADWLFAEVMAEYEPDTPVSWPNRFFSHDIRDEKGWVTHVSGEAMAHHLQRLDVVRSILLDAFRGMSLAEFRRLRRLEAYEVTPEWVLHHLIQHEAEHRGQILERRTEAERVLDPSV